MNKGTSQRLLSLCQTYKAIKHAETKPYTLLLSIMFSQSNQTKYTPPALNFICFAIFQNEKENKNESFPHPSSCIVSHLNHTWCKIKN
jgi:hypothetical protein